MNVLSIRIVPWKLSKNTGCDENLLRVREIYCGNMSSMKTYLISLGWVKGERLTEKRTAPSEETSGIGTEQEGYSIVPLI